jgi:ATP-dependent RNA helicase RhlE
LPFAGFNLHPNLLRGVKELGFQRPIPIKADAIPPALEGRDVLACAMTGSGKTVAFLLPILNHLIEKSRGTTRVLILTPTRELAAQILGDLNDLAVHTPISSAAVYGGVGMGPQEHAFRSGADVVVATPGRLLDHFDYPKDVLVFSRTKHRADRVADFLVKRGIAVERIHGNRRRTSARRRSRASRTGVTRCSS